MSLCWCVVERRVTRVTVNKRMISLKVTGLSVTCQRQMDKWWKNWNSTAKVLQEFVNKEGVRTSKLQSPEQSELLDLGGYVVEIHALHGNVFRRKPKRGEKNPKTRIGEANHDRTLETDRRQRSSYLGARGRRIRWPRVVQNSKEIWIWNPILWWHRRAAKICAFQENLFRENQEEKCQKSRNLNSEVNSGRLLDKETRHLIFYSGASVWH